MNLTNRTFMWLLRIATFLTLFCRGWLYLRWNCPLREIFWTEKWMTPLVDYFLHMDWAQFSQTSDPYITFLFRAIGIFLMVAGGAALFVSKNTRRLTDILVVATFFTILHAFAAWHGKDYQIGMLIEMALQAFSPLLLLVAIRRGIEANSFDWISKAVIALTFVGHGLYAVGHHPVPANFVTMSMNILSLSEGISKSFLLAAGYLDFIAAALIFLPYASIRKYSFYYMVFWGFVTALARVVNHYNPAEKFNGIDPWLFETLVRTPHWALPLIMGLLIANQQKQNTLES
ncbi:hypothetical protein Rhal01_02279 [Rubritalea halochordaticola]|uniref:Uncharacterized protein n=1 Tax=Rubritalea halochordaticola TaxID=714537 RepID=A0ABP9V078_9BACT